MSDYIELRHAGFEPPQPRVSDVGASDRCNTLTILGAGYVHVGLARALSRELNFTLFSQPDEEDPE